MRHLTQGGTSVGKQLTYIEKIEAHWEVSIQLARIGGANTVQIQCLRDLAISEFGYRSGAQLKAECFWDTFVDIDGDVVLVFSDKDDGCRNYVRVAIDHRGIMNTIDGLTNIVHVFNPRSHVPVGFTSGSTLTWSFTADVFKRFTRSAVDVSSRFGKASARVDGMEFVPYFLNEHEALTEFATEYIENVQPDLMCDGPMNGELDLVNTSDFDARRCWFHLVYEDEVSNSRIYAVCTVPPLCRLKMFCNRVLSRLDKILSGQVSTLPKFNVMRTLEQSRIGYCAL